MKKTFLFVLCGFLPVSGLYAVNIGTQYGLIQNVGNYSSNSGWYPDAPYNQTFPRPVYVNGTDLKTDDCQRAVSAVIESYCASHNGCSGVRLVDVRGDLLTQLARLPGHAFATACAGFVDTMFDEYVANRPLQQAAFPVAKGGVSNNTTTTPTFTEPTMPNWQAEYIDRVNELAELQAQNAAGTGVNPDDFPKTFSDLSFAERNEILAQGYEPYKDKSAYTPIEVESYENYTNRLKEHAKMLYEEQLRQFCLENPKDDKCVNGSQSSAKLSGKNSKSDAGRKELIEKIIEVLPK